MIELKENGIVCEGIKDRELSFLYDSLELLGFRWVIVVLIPKKMKISNKENYTILKYKKGRIFVIPFSSRGDFIKINEMLKSNKIDDYYITINSNIKNIISKINEMIALDFFSIDNYVDNFNKTIHKRVNDFFIDIDIFKTYKYALFNLVKRYNK